MSIDIKIRKTKPPPIFIPSKFLNQYTLNGKACLSYLYLDDTYSPDKPIVYTKEMVDSYIERIKNKDVVYYKETNAWFYQALEKIGSNILPKERWGYIVILADKASLIR